MGRDHLVTHIYLINEVIMSQRGYVTCLESDSTNIYLNTAKTRLYIDTVSLFYISSNYIVVIAPLSRDVLGYLIPSNTLFNILHLKVDF